MAEETHVVRAGAVDGQSRDDVFPPVVDALEWRGTVADGRKSRIAVPSARLGSVNVGGLLEGVVAPPMVGVLGDPPQVGEARDQVGIARTPRTQGRGRRGFGVCRRA